MLTRGIRNPTPGAPVSLAVRRASAKSPTQNSDNGHNLGLLAAASEFIDDPLNELYRELDIGWVADAAPDDLFDDTSWSDLEAVFESTEAAAAVTPDGKVIARDTVPVWDLYWRT